MSNHNEPLVDVVYRIRGQDSTVTVTVPENQMERKIKTLLKQGYQILTGGQVLEDLLLPIIDATPILEA